MEGELLQQHQVIVRRECARFRGREVNTAEDGFLIAFDGPGRAIRRELSISAERVGNPATPVICLTDRKTTVRYQREQ